MKKWLSQTKVNTLKTGLSASRTGVKKDTKEPVNRLTAVTELAH